MKEFTISSTLDDFKRGMGISIDGEQINIPVYLRPFVEEIENKLSAIDN